MQRPGLERVHDALRSGDVLAVWRLDRLGRSPKHLIELMAELEAERIGLESVTESIDEICKAVGISRPTLYKYVAAAGGR